MKKLAVILALVSPAVWASAQQALIERLDKVDAFSTNYVQKVVSPEGTQIASETGEMVLKRPNRFFMRTEVPIVLSTNGVDLWHFDEFLEQVTIQRFDDVTAHTPFMLLAGNQASDWQDYTVSQDNDVFALTPKSGASSNQALEITIQDSGRISQFTLVEQDGQRTNYQFNDFTTTGLPHDDFFTFTVPEGVDVDDQR
ncbi:outer membrane lipoprotein chaperone LolA [Thaumasiovibrio subtropicus]|uniref:outer membrane lipoprotein chaperone LolA n=1 Tax=Thaumasiovibrio subtropicus TaxID=1891207 RepID=UPI000B34F30E|nr:outer membrane lipoprotein chaperone LolA [Thaumasiovibrio subtropicus]